jgi:hypothetical protein
LPEGVLLARGVAPVVEAEEAGVFEESLPLVLLLAVVSPLPPVPPVVPWSVGAVLGV